MRVFLTGGTGLIGRGIIQRLIERGDQAVVVTRKADQFRRRRDMRSVTVVQGDPTQAGDWQLALDGCDAVVNLAGHNLFADRWSPEVKRRIRDSRVYSTEHVVEAIGRASQAPRVLVQASAIGYYGPHGDEELTESSPPGTDFMAVVCREWEEAARGVESLGVRLATLRTGIVLALGEGALGVMGPIFKMGGAAPIGGGDSLFRPGSGQQWMSWIHHDDIVGLYLFALDRDAATGPINGTAPHPVRNHEFGRALAHALWRPFLPFGPPNFVIGALLGEVAQVVLKGQRVLPTRAQELGYTFAYPDLVPALKELFTKKPAPAPAPRPQATASAGHHHH
ncbi:MAG: TIGR01777 family oxidoreductase [Isosphaeraceae bacterium]